MDWSIYATSVGNHAASISQRTGAPVDLIHVPGRSEASDAHDLSGPVKLGTGTELLNELAELDAQRAKLISQRGRAILDDARAILDRDGVLENTTRRRHGAIVETVAEVERDAGMILIGKRDDTAEVAKGRLGSNPERIVRASRKPVFVAARAFRPISTVLVGDDGRASAMKAVDRITRSPLSRGLPVHVVTPGNATPEAVKGLADAQAVPKAAGLVAGSEARPQIGRPVSSFGSSPVRPAA